MPGIASIDNILDMPTYQAEPDADEKVTLVCLGERTPVVKDEGLRDARDIGMPYDRIRMVAIVPDERRDLRGPKTLETQMVTDVARPFSLPLFMNRIQSMRDEGTPKTPYLCVHNEADRHYALNPVSKTILPCYATGGFPAVQVPKRRLSEAFDDMLAYARVTEPYHERLKADILHRAERGDDLAIGLLLMSVAYGRDAPPVISIIYEDAHLREQYRIGDEVRTAVQRARTSLEKAVMEPLYTLDLSNLHAIRDAHELPGQYRAYTLSWLLGDENLQDGESTADAET